LRDETEWVETVEVGWNKLVGTEPERIIEAWFNFVPPMERPPIFGDGTAARRIAQILESGILTFGLPRGQNAAPCESLEPLEALEMGVNL